KLFLFKLRVGELETIALTMETQFQRNAIVLGFGRPGEADALRDRDDVCFRDVAAIIEGEAFDCVGISHRIIALSHFHFRSEDPTSNQRKLEMLEDLARHQSDKTILILTTVDPMFFIDGAYPGSGALSALSPGDSIDRWASALSEFDRFR